MDLVGSSRYKNEFTSIMLPLELFYSHQSILLLKNVESN